MIFMSKHPRDKLFIFFITTALVFIGCSASKIAISSFIDILGSDKNLAFVSDDDPELVRDALPFTLKLYETLLEKAPENLDLAVAACRAFVLYASFFVQLPAEQPASDAADVKKSESIRAKKLYIRGRNYVLDALDRRYPGFNAQIKSGSIDSALCRISKDDTAALYWAGVAWAGAALADRADLGMLLSLKRAVGLIDKVSELNEGFGHGAIHEFYISYYGNAPASTGGGEQKAREHFSKAVELSKGKKAGPYVSLAVSVSLKNRDKKEFVDLLNKAMEVDIKERNEYRLINILNRRKALWLLNHLEDYFPSCKDSLLTNTTNVHHSPDGSNNK